MVAIDPRAACGAAELWPARIATRDRGAPAGAGRVPLLFLLADTGGGHRSAARAVSEALEEAYPGRFDPVLCDPLAGRGSSRLLRWVTGLYGPVTRLAPWAWGAVYYACDSRFVMRLLQRTLLALADHPVADAVAAHQPAAIVSFHPLTGGAAARARQGQSRELPVVTVITDLVNSHAAWRAGRTDRMALPTAAVRLPGRRGGLAVNQCIQTGLPVTSGFWTGRCPTASGPLCAARSGSASGGSWPCSPGAAREQVAWPGGPPPSWGHPVTSSSWPSAAATCGCGAGSPGWPPRPADG
jgi:hypothetical protein